MSLVCCLRHDQWFNYVKRTPPTVCIPAPPTPVEPQPRAIVRLRFGFWHSRAEWYYMPKVSWVMSHGFVAHFIGFPALQKIWKSVKIWQSYREFKGGNFFWDTVYNEAKWNQTCKHLPIKFLTRKLQNSGKIQDEKKIQNTKRRTSINSLLICVVL